jgi:hypothetical protein
MKDNTTTNWAVVLRTSFITSVLTAIFTLVATLSGTYCAQQWQDERHLQDRRRQAFGELMGVRATLIQVARDFQDSKIHGVYNLRMHELTNNKLGLDEARRYVQVNETLSTELAKERKRLYEIIASIGVSFPEFPMETYANLNQIGRLPPVPSPTDIKNVKDLDEWHTKQLKLCEEFVEREIDKRLGQVIDQIANRLVVTADHASAKN